MRLKILEKLMDIFKHIDLDKTEKESSQQGSFEISDWFSIVKRRINFIQNTQICRIKWIKLSKKLYVHRLKENLKQIRKELNLRVKKTNYYQIWIEFSTFLRKNRRITRFKIAFRQLVTARNKYNVHKQVKKQIIPIKQDYYQDFKSDYSYQQATEAESSTNEESSIDSQMKIKWTSYVKRFTRQCQFLNLNQAKRDLITQLKIDRIRYEEKWIRLSTQVLQQAIYDQLELKCKEFNTIRNMWFRICHSVIHNFHYLIIKNDYINWQSSKFKTETEARSVWICYRIKLLHRYRVFNSIKKNLALIKINNFFRYIIVPIRAKCIVKYYTPSLVPFVLKTTQKDIMKSCSTIRSFSQKCMYHVADNFAYNFGFCLAEASTTVGSFHVTTPQEQPVIIHRKKPKRVTYSDRIRAAEKEYFDHQKQKDVQQSVDFNIMIDEDDDWSQPEELQKPKQKTKKSVFKETEVIISTNEDSKPKPGGISVVYEPECSDSTASMPDSPPTHITSKALEISEQCHNDIKPEINRQSIQQLDVPVVIPEGTRKKTPKNHKSRKCSSSDSIKSPIPEVSEILGMFNCRSLEKISDSSISYDDYSGSTIPFRFDEDPSSNSDKESIPMPSPIKKIELNTLSIDQPELVQSEDDNIMQDHTEEESEIQFQFENDEDEESIIEKSSEQTNQQKSMSANEQNEEQIEYSYEYEEESPHPQETQSMNEEDNNSSHEDEELILYSESDED